MGRLHDALKALKQAVDAKVPVVTVDRRVAQVEGILAHVGADNVKGGEAQGNLIVQRFPNGATIVNLQGQSGASPAIDRNKGLHNVLDKMKDKYKIVFEQTAGFDRAKGLSVTEAALAGMPKPPQVIVAANDDMALGAMEAEEVQVLDSLDVHEHPRRKETLLEARNQVGSSGHNSSLPSVTGDRIRLPEAVDDCLRDGPESHVSFGMSIAIVEVLKVIDVSHE